MNDENVKYDSQEKSIKPTIAPTEFLIPRDEKTMRTDRQQSIFRIKSSLPVAAEGLAVLSMVFQHLQALQTSSVILFYQLSIIILPPIGVILLFPFTKSVKFFPLAVV